MVRYYGDFTPDEIDQQRMEVRAQVSSSRAGRGKVTYLPLKAADMLAHLLTELADQNPSGFLATEAIEWSEVLFGDQPEEDEEDEDEQA